MSEIALKYYKEDSPNLQFFLLDVGEGLMTLIIFPNNSVMLFDCNVTEENEERIIQYLKSIIPFNTNPDTAETEQIIHVFVNSHRDEDHYRGLERINDEFPIISIWDSGQSGENTCSPDYNYYMKLRRLRKNKDNDYYKELNPSNRPVAIVDDAEIICMASQREYAKDYNNGTTVLSRSNEKIQHTNCIVLQIIYRGTSLLLAGDSDWRSWKESIIPNFNDSVKSEILIASHHGSRSFFTSEETIDEEQYPDTTYVESLDFISPDIVLIPCGDYRTYHHPNIEAKNIYLEKSKNRQVYSTYEWGSFEGIIKSNGDYTIVPGCFVEKRHHSNNVAIHIKCKYVLNGERNDVKNGDRLPIGGELEFSITTKGNIAEPFNAIKTYWKVSNGGAGCDSNHQEIYIKQKEENRYKLHYNRNLSYKGRHLLYFELINTIRKIAISKVFVVNGE